MINLFPYIWQSYQKINKIKINSIFTFRCWVLTSAIKPLKHQIWRIQADDVWAAAACPHCLQTAPLLIVSILNVKQLITFNLMSQGWCQCEACSFSGHTLLCKLTNAVFSAVFMLTVTLDWPKMCISFSQFKGQNVFCLSTHSVRLISLCTICNFMFSRFPLQTCQTVWGCCVAILTLKSR